MIKRIDAIDFDLGRNKELRYRIVDGDSGVFRIGAKTGDLLVRRPLNTRADANSVFNLVVEAEDGGYKVDRRRQKSTRALAQSRALLLAKSKTDIL